MPIISADGLFCCDKFEETLNEKASNMSKLTKSYFRPKYLYFKWKKESKDVGNKDLGSHSSCATT